MMKKIVVREFKIIAYLALPLILNLLSYMAMQFIDTVMLGRLGAVALAASALGGVVFIIILVGCIGILTSVGTLTAEAFGSGDIKKIQMINQQGLWLASFLAILGMILIWNAHYLLFTIKQPTPVVINAKSFLHGLFWGFLPNLLFITMREFITAISRPRIIVLISICAIPVNAFLNYWFIYGGFGVPALKIFGVGLATSFVEWLMLIALFIYLLTHREDFHINFSKIFLPKFKQIKQLISLGFPVGLSFIIEELLFVITAFFMGYLGITALAAHQIAVQCMTVFIMIPIAISLAAAVRVSQLRGSLEAEKAFISGYLSIILGLIFGLMVGCFLWAAPLFFVELFINTKVLQNQAIATLSVKLLFILAIFHLIDAAQIITNGVLRGYQDTLIPMFLGIISFWLVGIGGGYILGFVYHYGAVGLWWGLAFGVTVSAILLQLRLWSHRKE